MRLWDVATRKPIGEPLRGHTFRVYGVAFSPDGKVLASASEDGTVRMWEVATRQAIGEPISAHDRNGYHGTVNGVAFSLDGKTLASADSDGEVHLWDVATHKPRGFPLRGHSEIVLSVAFSPDGKTLASGGLDKTIRLWDVETRQLRGEPLRAHSDAVSSLAFSPDGKTLASGSRDKIRLWEVAPRVAPPSGWNVSLDRGKQACADSSYAEAAEYFENAVALKPDSIDARRCLAAAYMRAYAPGGVSPENSAMGRKVEESLRKILDLAAGDKAALGAFGGFRFYEASVLPPSPARTSKLDEATSWFEKLLGIDSGNRDALFSLAVIDWNKAYPQLMEARAKLRMQPEDPGPIRAPRIRQELEVRIGPLYDDAIKKLRRVLELNTHDADAMAYLSLCIREQADLASPGDYASQIKEANEWFERARKEEFRANPANGPCDLSTAAYQMAAPLAAPPPPPPPPRRVR